MADGNGDISFLQQEIATWADSLIPNRTAHQALTKLALEEIPEFLLEPDSPGEYADLVILILDIAHLQGIDVKAAVLEKMNINKNREWEVDPKTGIMSHLPNCMSYEQWYLDVEEWFYIEMAESGADRELDYDPEQILEDRYEVYRKEHQ
jgi:hypothetical protein